MRRTGIVFIALVAALGSVQVASSPGVRAASADGACVGDSGVTVVVDGTRAGGNISVRCALGAQPNGWDALVNAGHQLTSVPQYPGAAVCTIDGRPSEGFPTCWETNFWSYWHAPNAGSGATWTFSGLGAAVYKPAPGSVEGWSYTSAGNRGQPPGAGPVFPESQPTTTTPAAVAPAPPVGPGGTSGPSANGAPSAANPGSPRSTAASPSTVGSATTGPPTAGDPSSTPSSLSASARDAGDDDTNGRAIDGVDLSSDTNEGGGGLPPITFVGIALIIAIAASAGLVARRRHSSAASGDG